MGLASNSAYTSTAARDLHRTQQVRLAAIVCSGISVTASFVAFYWFFRMRKLFRHRLIMLLVYGDVMRSVWYFVFAIYSLARGTVKTESRFCQTSGFFIQYGTETSDYAVLAVAVHSALQIFRPAARGTSDGLYDYRIYVFSGAFLIPGMMSALAFVNPGPAYESLGAFCQLPLRPFWYRLALAWIPRYMIAVIILSLAGAIYAYVGCEFRSYANLSQSSMTALSTTVGMSLADGDVETAIEQAQVDRPPSHLPNLSRRASSVAHDVVSTNRRGSTVAFGPTTYAPSQLVSEHVPLTQSLSGSSTYLPLKRTASVRPGLVAIPSGYTVKLSLSALDLQGPISPRTQPMEDPMSTTPPEIASKVEALIPKFKLTRLLNSDQAGRRISLYGTIDSQPAVLVAERAAFDTSASNLSSFSTSLRNIKNLGANDIYSWFLANSNPTAVEPPPDFKLNLIYPCTDKHVKKYSAQGLRVVTETPDIYASYIRPYMAAQREKGALNWVFNIIEGRTEQEDVMYREVGVERGFLLLPDLNWDRKTIEALHLLGLVERRDIWSVRDLKKGNVEWLKYMKDKMVEATCGLYQGIDRDQLKLYVHYQPTYYHFHIHIVHVALEAGNTQATGKALGLDNIVSQLETMVDGHDAGMKDASLTYHLGERSDLWEKVYLPLKDGRQVNVDGF